MCDAPGTTVSSLDREAGKLRGYVICGCGRRREVPIAPRPGAPPTLGIDYRPTPDLRRADLVAER